jgi:LuxR family maltose regulon positive regulatory protein
VFEKQPANPKAFMLQTAILHQWWGSLGDAVLGLGGWWSGIGKNDSAPNPQLPTSNPQAYSRLILEELEHANLFVTPLDGERCWYRYHRQFRAFLRARLEREASLTVADLHRRASLWYEQNQLLPQAVKHALAAGEIARASDLVEASATAMAGRGIAANDTQKLLDAFYKTISDERGAVQEASTVYRSSFAIQPLVEPLSDRELEVLRLIASGASNQAIAATLVISIGTVKSHINHILGKLSASNRTEAVSRARELGLFAV